jgi:hypothetical protein
MRIVISRLKDEHDQKDYRNFLYSQTNSLFYHGLHYHQLLQAHLDCEAYYILAYDERKILGALPFLMKQNNQFGAVINSLPFYGSNGGFIIDSALELEKINQIRQNIIQSLESFSLEHNVIASTIISNPLQPEDQLWMDNNYATTHTDKRIGQITLLPADGPELEQRLMSIFEDPRPRNIRRAIKAGTEISECHDKASLDFLFQVHKENIEGIGGKAKQKSFFDLIPANFSKDEYSVFIATINGKRIAALLVFYFNSTVEYFTPATLHDYRNDQPSALLIFEAMKIAIHRGFKHWNWGGTWYTQHGVYDFKKKWGAQDHQYHYYTRVREDYLNRKDNNDLFQAFPYFYILPLNSN